MIYKRKDSKVLWYGFTVNGTRYQGSTGRTKRVEALQVANAIYKATLDRVQLGVKPDITFEEAFEEVVQAAKPGTQRSYRTCANKLLGRDPENLLKHQGRARNSDKWHLNPYASMSTLNEATLAEHIEHRKAEGLRPNSINVEIRFLQLVYNRVRTRYNVKPELKFKKLPGFQKKRYLSEWEENAVLDRLREKQGSPAYDKAYDLAVFLVDTGVRLNEAIDLRWPQVDFELRQIEIYRQKTDVLSLVPITGRVFDILMRRRNAKKPFEEMSRAIRVLRNVISEVCNVDDLTVQRRGEATIHTLRDTFATRLVDRGLSLHKIALLLGHKDILMTKKYAHLETRNVVDEARNLLEKAA